MSRLQDRQSARLSPTADAAARMGPEVVAALLDALRAGIEARDALIDEYDVDCVPFFPSDQQLWERASGAFLSALP